MRHLVPLFCFVCVLWNESAANPILDLYAQAGISEVYIASPFEWYVELDGSWCLFNYHTTEYPCSSDVFLRIKPRRLNQEIFGAKVRFAGNKRAVIDPRSLRLNREQGLRYPDLKSTDTIMIAMDSLSLVSSPARQNQYWRIPLRPVPAGNSLIAIDNFSSESPKLYSTSRRSIGSPGNYVTRYKITLKDMHGNPLRDIKGSVDYFNTYSDKTGSCYVSRAINDYDTVLTLTDSCVAFAYQSLYQLPPLSIPYLDTDTLLKKTINIPVTQYSVTGKNSDTSNDVLWLMEYSNTYHFLFRFRSMQTLYFRVYESMPGCSFCFAQNDPHTSSDCLATWQVRYIDTAAIIHTTITIPSSGIVSTRAAHARPVKTGVTLAGLVQNNRDVRIVVSSALPAASGVLSLYAINGKEIKSLPVVLHGSGTSTVPFRFPGKQLSPGKYLCRLTINGFSAAACQIIIP